MTDDTDELEPIEEGDEIEDFEAAPDEPEGVDPDAEIDLDDELGGFDDEATVAPVVDEDEDEDEDDTPRPRARKVTDDDDDDDDEEEDDVEADLDAILRDRLASSDDDDDEDGEDTAKTTSASSPGRGAEIVCQSCFLLVNSNQLRDPEPRCHIAAN